ncbi:MAG: amidohydrolase family protein, partial [Ginsengibacter sp.]
LKLNNPFHIKQSYVIHAGEGIDEAAHKEIDKLIKANYFHKSLFAVHGVAMDEEQAKSFKAVIWCPVSNFFLLNKTADIQRLKTKTRILFGTDSTLTADWNLWNHLRVARNTGLMNDQELYQSLTKTPSLAWNQNNIGAIAMNKNADIIIAKITQNNHFDTFYSLNPESLQLVLHQGQIRLFDEEIKDQLMDSNFKIASFSPITIHGKRKYIYGNMGQLMDEISTYYSESHFPINKCTTAF